MSNISIRLDETESEYEEVHASDSLSKRRFLSPEPTSKVAEKGSFVSLSMFFDREGVLLSPVNKCNAVLLQGPRKILRLCLFGFLLPLILISVPLYVRIILYPPYHFMMAPTDQRLLDQTSSSIWCQGQNVHMNGSFNAFLLPEGPRTKTHLSTHTMLQHLRLKDDVKEYWGFFLQKGSLVSINLCNRYDGGMLMIMRGVNNLHKCAWIGEEDSAEQDEDHDEASNESGQISELTHEFPMVPGEILMRTESASPLASRAGLKSVEITNLTSEERREKFDYHLKKALKLAKNPDEIMAGLSKGKINNLKFDSNAHQKKSKFKEKNKRKIKRKRKTSKALSREAALSRLKRDLEKIEEPGGEVGIVNPNDLINIENSSYEVSEHTRDLYLNLFKLPKDLIYERGKIDQTSPHDTSNEEHRSSFSSSEEALTKCSGLIGVMPIYPSRNCSSYADTRVNRIKYRIPRTGTYYFVFSSDNEVFDSSLFFNMTLERVVFDTDNAKKTCINMTECSLAFSFWSHDQSVVELPESDWNSAFSMEVTCQPRVTIYLLFLFLVPVVILFCALH